MRRAKMELVMVTNASAPLRCIPPLATAAVAVARDDDAVVATAAEMADDGKPFTDVDGVLNADGGADARGVFTRDVAAVAD